MSRSSPTPERPSNTSPLTAGTQYSHPYASGASAESSRPSTAARPETYGSYGQPGAGKYDPESVQGDTFRRRSGSSTAQTPTRAFGVHSILNPPTGVNDTGQRPGDPSAQSNLGPRQSMLPAPTVSPPTSRKRSDPRSPPREFEPMGPRQNRRMLTPKSPAVRAASLGTRRNPAFQSTMQALQPTAASGGRIYTAEPGPYQYSEIPPLPPLAIATGSNQTNLPPLDTSGRSRLTPSQENPVRALEGGSNSQNERPSQSQPTYGAYERPSPNFRYSAAPPPQPASSFRVLPAGSSGGFSQESHVHGPHEGYQAPQASYHMTLETDQGPVVVPVELDTQQASKVADEKRKRNAGASARFRARRKEKEKEASQTISGLQQELRDLIEERDFYLAERNYFRDLAVRHLPPSQLMPRPPSPRHHRPPPSASGQSPEVTHSSEEGYLESGSSAQRRRTGDYQPSFVGGQMKSPTGSSYAPTFPSRAPLSLPPPALGPNSFSTPRMNPPGPPPPPSATRSQSYDPFRGSLQDRSWPAPR